MGCKKLLDTSMQDVGAFNQEKESATNVTLEEDPLFKEQQVLGFINQVCLSLLCRNNIVLYPSLVVNILSKV